MRPKKWQIYGYTICSTPDLFTEARVWEKQGKLVSVIWIKGARYSDLHKSGVRQYRMFLPYLKLISKTSGTFLVLLVPGSRKKPLGSGLVVSFVYSMVGSYSGKADQVYSKAVMAVTASEGYKQVQRNPSKA